MISPRDAFFCAAGVGYIIGRMEGVKNLEMSAPSTTPDVRMAQPRVGFVSLGCPKNLVDSEVMMGILAQAGATIVPDAETADVLVVNTCSFIDKAKQESIDTILEMAQHKAGGKATRLVVAGCMVERYRDEIQKNIPEVDAVVGTGELEQILAAAGLGAPIADSGSAADSPFRILTTAEAAIAHAQKAITANSRDVFPVRAGKAPSPACRIISTTSTRRDFELRRAVPRTSKSPKAATTLAASALFRNFGANSVRGDLNPWWQRWSVWSWKVCRKSH